MELLALVLINIVFGIILYYAVSIKVTSSVRDYQIVKLKKEIQELKREYANPPKNELVENFIFLTKNIDFVIVDY